MLDLFFENGHLLLDRADSWELPPVVMGIHGLYAWIGRQRQGIGQGLLGNGV